jgi:hypothetical protein
MAAEERMTQEMMDSVPRRQEEKLTELLFCGLIGIWFILGFWFSASMLMVFLKELRLDLLMP